VVEKGLTPKSLDYEGSRLLRATEYSRGWGWEQNASTTPMRHGASRRVLRKMTALPSMIVSSLIAGGYMVGTLAIAAIALMQQLELGWIALAGALVAFVFNGFFIVGSIVAWVSEPSGFDALLVAMNQPRYPVWMRPLVAMWWLLHWAFAMFLALSLMLERPAINLGLVLFTTVLAVGLAYASYSYLLMTVTVFTKAPNVLKRAWTWRSTWAACHGALSVIIALAVEWLR
jgi:hypothetical protein